MVDGIYTRAICRLQLRITLPDLSIPVLKKATKGGSEAGLSRRELISAMDSRRDSLLVF
jgi:hypothetical protein